MDDGKCPEKKKKLENIWIDLIRGIYAPYTGVASSGVGMGG